MRCYNCVQKAKKVALLEKNRFFRGKPAKTKKTKNIRRKPP